MRGECSGNVRSTPTPYEMRRTVKDARTLSPRFRMTMLSKSCVRSFSPSTTLTCTRTVSPWPNPPRSFLNCAASTSRIASITFLPLSFPFLTPPPRPPRRLPAAPARDARVVAGQEHRRNARAPELFGPRVLRRLEQPRRERLAPDRALGPEHAGQQARHRVRHHERRQLAARQHVVAH